MHGVAPCSAISDQLAVIAAARADRVGLAPAARRSRARGRRRPGGGCRASPRPGPGSRCRRRAGRRSRRRSPPGRACRWPARSAASTNSAAAASASRRRSIGVVPAWPAWPSKARLKRVWPAIAVTTPSGRPAASSTGPCSMWTSKYARAPSNSGVAERAADRVAERDAVRVAQLQLVGLERADERAAAEERALEAQPLLVGERDQLDRHVVVERLDDREADEHAEDAVVAAGVGHRVQVRADHQRRARRRGARRGCRARRCGSPSRRPPSTRAAGPSPPPATATRAGA